MSNANHPVTSDLTDEEGAEVQAIIAAPPEVPELTEANFAAMRPASEVLPETPGEEPKARRRGRPPSPHPKVSLTLRIDLEVVAAFRAGGEDWRARINEALRAAVLGTRAGA